MSLVRQRLSALGGAGTQVLVRGALCAAFVLAAPGQALATSAQAMSPVATTTAVQLAATNPARPAALSSCPTAPTANTAHPASGDAVQKVADPVARFVVMEGSDDQWQAVADWPQETDIPYSVTGTMPADIADRETFAYWLVAEPGEGLAYVEGSARVTLTHDDGSTADVTSVLTVGTEDAQVVAGSPDLRAAIPDVTATDTLTLIYDARLTDDAHNGYERGNESFAHLEYTSRGAQTSTLAAQAIPLTNAARQASTQALDVLHAHELLHASELEGHATDLARSPDLRTVVYTYTLEVRKLDQNTHDPLAGATFALRDAEGRWYVDGDDWSADKTKAAMRTTDDSGMVTFTHIDSERYDVVEIMAPQGYGLAPSVDVRIDAAASEGEETPVLVAKSARGTIETVRADKGRVRLSIEDPQIQSGAGANGNGSGSNAGTASQGAGSTGAAGQGANGSAAGADASLAAADQDTSGARRNGLLSTFSRLFRGLLARTADVTRAVWPLVLISVLVLLGGGLIRRQGRWDTQRQPEAHSDAVAGTAERKHHDTD